MATGELYTCIWAVSWEAVSDRQTCEVSSFLREGSDALTSSANFHLSHLMSQSVNVYERDVIKPPAVHKCGPFTPTGYFTEKLWEDSVP